MYLFYLCHLFSANVSSYSHYVFSALVQEDSEVITFEVVLSEYKGSFKLSMLQDFVVGLSVLVNGSQVIMK